MRHKSKNKTRPLFTLSLEMTRLVNETRLLLVPSVNSDIYGNPLPGWSSCTNIIHELIRVHINEGLHLGLSEVVFIEGWPHMGGWGWPYRGMSSG